MTAAAKVAAAPEPTEEAAAVPTVVQALSLVMEAVQAVGKTGVNTQQHYNFRGVDAVVNAVGPALRKHGVVVVPIAATVEEERYTTKSGAAMKGVTATVTFRFYGPAGDFIDAQVCGESSDSGDKAVPKAHSVAYRTMLLQALCIPTDEPDPDESSVERAVDPHGLQSSRADAVIGTPIEDPGAVVLTFGKHRDKPICDVPREYLDWWTGEKPPTNPELQRQRAAAEMFLATDVDDPPVAESDIPF
jgi:hypothetical protein